MKFIKEFMFFFSVPVSGALFLGTVFGSWLLAPLLLAFLFVMVLTNPFSLPSPQPRIVHVHHHNHVAVRVDNGHTVRYEKDVTPPTRLLASR